MNVIQFSSLPDMVFNAVGKIVALERNHGLVEFHFHEYSTAFALFNLNDIYIDCRETNDLTEIYWYLTHNPYIYFDAKHIMFHPVLKNKTVDKPSILNALYITTKIWMGLRPLTPHTEKQKDNVVTLLKPVLHYVFNLNVTENFDHIYDYRLLYLTTTLQTSLSDAIGVVIDIVNTENGILKINANDTYIFVIFNIRTLYIDGIKCDISKTLSEFIFFGMKLHCNAKRINNVHGNYLATCVWIGRKPKAVDIFSNIVSGTSKSGLELMEGLVYVGVVLQLHPPDSALLMTSDTQNVSYVILNTECLRVSETQPFIAKGSWIDDFLDLSEILFFKIGTKQQHIFYFASDAWFPDKMEINGNMYMVFDDMALKKSLLMIEKEYQRFSKSVILGGNVERKDIEINKISSEKIFNEIKKPLPKCIKFPAISEVSEENEFVESFYTEKQYNNSEKETFVFNYKANLNVEGNKEMSSVSTAQALDEYVDKTSSEVIAQANEVNTLTSEHCNINNCSGNCVMRPNYSELKGLDTNNSASNTQTFDRLEKGEKSPDKLITITDFLSQYNCDMTSNHSVSIKSDNHENKFSPDLFQETKIELKRIKKKKVQFREDVKFNSKHMTNNLNVAKRRNEVAESEGHRLVFIACGDFIFISSQNMGCLLVEPNLKISFTIHVLYANGKPCSINQKLLDHISVGQKLNCLVSRLRADSYVAWCVWDESEFPNDVVMIKNLLKSSIEKMETLANNALYYATVVKLSPPIATLLSVQNEKQYIPVVLFAENLYSDGSGNQLDTCMFEELQVGDSLEVKVKKHFFNSFENKYFVWEAFEAWKRMPYATELSKRKTIALKAPHYLHCVYIPKKKKRNKRGNVSVNHDNLSEAEDGYQIENKEMLGKQTSVKPNNCQDKDLSDVYYEDNQQIGNEELEQGAKIINVIEISESTDLLKNDTRNTEFEQGAKIVDVNEILSESTDFHKTDAGSSEFEQGGKRMNINEISESTYFDKNDFGNTESEKEPKIIEVNEISSEGTDFCKNDEGNKYGHNEVQLSGTVESVCCWYAVIVFQDHGDTQKALCYKNALVPQSSTPLEQILHIGTHVVFNIEHLREPSMECKYRATNVSVTLNNSSNPESSSTKYNSNHKPSPIYLRNQTGKVKSILSDDEGIIESCIRGISLQLRFNRSVLQMKNYRNLKLDSFLHIGHEVYFEAELLSYDISNSSVKINRMWYIKKLKEDVVYNGIVIELRLPYAFIAQVFNEKVFVFNRNFRSHGEGSSKLPANHPIGNYVCVGSEVKVIVQRNKSLVSDKFYQFSWSAKDSWLHKK